jgi:uncharacterized protein (TIGR02145 family)
MMNPFRTFGLLTAGVLLLCVTISACGDTSNDKGAEGDACVLDRDCAEGLICAADGCAPDDSNPDGDASGDWTDSASGLTWEQPGERDGMTYSEAESYCESLVIRELADWRLPTVTELRSLIKGCASTQSEGSCNVREDCLAESCKGETCNYCINGEGPADGCYWPTELTGTCGNYWSSSQIEGYDEYRWHVAFVTAGISYTSANESALNLVRCVREGE